MSHLTLPVSVVFQQKSGLIIGLKTDVIISPTPKQFKVEDYSYLNSLYMHKSNKTRGSFDPVLSLLAGLVICYLQRATQSWTWEHRDCHALSGFPTGYPRETTKCTTSQPPRTGEKRFKEKMQPEKEHNRMICRTSHVLPEGNMIWEKAGHSAAKGCRAPNYSCKKQSPFCLSPAWECLTSQPQHCCNTALLLGSFPLGHAHGPVTAFGGTTCRTRQHSQTRSFWSTLSVDLP